jgi:hypothetical protein
MPIGLEVGWASEPVWTQELEEKSSAPNGDRTPIVQPVVRHYTAWANQNAVIYYSFMKRLNKYIQGQNICKCYTVQVIQLATEFVRVTKETPLK